MPKNEYGVAAYVGNIINFRRPIPAQDQRLDAHARDLITMRAELDARDGRG